MTESFEQAARDAEARYGDIIHLQHPVSAKHPQMTREQRAAQFAPFAALTGYEKVVEHSVEEAREAYLHPMGNVEEAGEAYLHPTGDVEEF